MAINKHESPYIRVGTSYYRIIHKPDRFGIVRRHLKGWNRQELMMDHGQKYMRDEIPKYLDFVLWPTNDNDHAVVDGCFNLYHQFAHTPKKPKSGDKYKGIYWTRVLMKEIFGSQFKLGFQYLKVLYENPRQALPVLVLASEERQTGKSTFLDWLNALFGDNMAMIEPDSIGKSFNSEYAGSNIIGIDETIIERKSAVEKIKSLATSKFVTLNMKFVEPIKVPFYGKIIMTTNNEDDFMRIDDKEIRFWIRKLKIPKIKNHKILDDCIDEIPYFLYYLKNMPSIDYTKNSRMVFTDLQIMNASLEAVKAQSKSNLYKELEELMIDYFSNNPDEAELEVIPKDIKDEWFRNDGRISINYIRKVIKSEFRKEPVNSKRYEPFRGLEKIGRPFVFKREHFVNDNEDGTNNALPF